MHVQLKYAGMQELFIVMCINILKNVKKDYSQSCQEKKSKYYVMS